MIKRECGCIREYLKTAISNCHLPSYIYGYPSKRAYRKFETPIDLKEVWGKQKGNLNLYIHIPFCNYKCTYCTLLSAKINDESLIKAYNQALIREIKEYGKIAGHMTVDSIYLGGGTPTILSKPQLKELFDAVTDNFPNIAQDAEIAIEGSPETLDLDKVRFLKEIGVNRVSMGIQTLNKEELKKTGRQHSIEESIQAINNIKQVGFKNFNLDLIYGLENQTKETWLESLQKTIEFKPNSMNLYPVVIRPLAGIQKAKEQNSDKFITDDSKYELYDISCEYMYQNGYHQETFVSFTKLKEDSYKQQVSDFQGNPLIGIGASARSYTNTLHYSTDYVVTKRSTLNIISDYCQKGFENLISHGFELDMDEQKRRSAILNLIISRLNAHEYKKKFDSDIWEEFGQELKAMEEEGCIETNKQSGQISLTQKGFKYSSILGSIFYSEKVKELEKNYTDK